MSNTLSYLRNNLPRVLPILTLVIYGIVVTLGSFIGGLWSIAAISGALLMFLGTALLDRRWPRPSEDFAVLAMLALLDMGLLNFFSINPVTSWFEWQRLGTIFLSLMLLSSPALRARAYHARLFDLLLGGALLGAVTLGLELASGGLILKAYKGPYAGLSEYNRGFSYLVLLAFPIMAALRWNTGDRATAFLTTHLRWLLILFFVLLLFIPAGLTESRAAKLALVTGLGVTLLAMLTPVVTQRILAAAVVMCLGWPFAARTVFTTHREWLALIPKSWLQRVEIWDYMSYRIMERPLLGWGLGTSSQLDFKNPHGALYALTTVAAPHPHNAVTQLWVETGLPGLALGFAFAFLTLYRAGRLETRLVPFAFGAWAGAVCLSMVAYNLWTDSLFSAFALTGFAFALLEIKLKRMAVRS